MSKSRAGSKKENKRRRKGAREQEKKGSEVKGKGVWRMIEIVGERPRHGGSDSKAFSEPLWNTKG